MRCITDQNLSISIKKTVFVFLFLLGHIFSQSLGFCEENAEKFDFLLPAPIQQIHHRYLGLSSDQPFSPGQIKAQVVIIEIFSMYCPICQREAEKVNGLFRLIQSRPGLREKIKLIGIGAGNSDFEVGFFREKYNIEFPLFSDARLFIHKKTGEVRTPHFFGLSLKKIDGIQIFYSKTGGFSDPESFLQTIIKESGIKE